MHLFCIAAALSFAAFLTHWLIWRVWIPRRQTAALLIIFSVVLVLGLAATSTTSAGSWQLQGYCEALQVVLFHVAGMLAYIVAYSALEERSPSMTILTKVADSGRAGTTRREVGDALLRLSPVEIRLVALVRDGMLDKDGDTYRLTAKGQRWATLFSWWRTLLGFGQGG